jgi:hypothetical protein
MLFRGIITAYCEILAEHTSTLCAHIVVFLNVKSKSRTKLRGFSPQANYNERTNERTPHFGEVSANFCEQRVSRGQRNGSPRQLISIF